MCIYTVLADLVTPDGCLNDLIHVMYAVSLFLSGASKYTLLSAYHPLTLTGHKSVYSSDSTFLSVCNLFPKVSPYLDISVQFFVT